MACACPARTLKCPMGTLKRPAGTLKCLVRTLKCPVGTFLRFRDNRGATDDVGRAATSSPIEQSTPRQKRTGLQYKITTAQGVTPFMPMRMKCPAGPFTRFRDNRDATDDAGCTATSSPFERSNAATIADGAAIQDHDRTGCHTFYADENDTVIRLSGW